MSFFVIVLFWFAHQVFICNNNFYVDSAEIRPFRVSTNATKLFVGETFTMRCELLAGFKHDNNLFRMYFQTDNHGWLIKYEIPATTAVQKEKKFEIRSETANFKEFSSIRPRNIDNITNFEIDITTSQTVFSMNFNCDAYNDTINIDSFNKIAISTSALPPPPPSPSLISSVSAVQLNHSFTLTCSLQFNTFQFAPNRSYSVAFFNGRDGELAKYDVDASGNSFFTYGEFGHVSVTTGARTAFPNFDLTITEMADAKQSYWCEIATDWTSVRRQSSKWNYDDPVVDFSATSAGNNAHRGRCSVANFAHHTETEYQVQFYSDLGPSTKNLLGYFWVRPHKKTQFVFEHLPQWTLIDHGASIEYPNFEIVASSAANLANSGNRWWCALHTGSPGATSELVKSNVKNL